MNNPFANAIVNAGTYVPREGDYIGEDGFWYCGKCRTPRQCRLTEDNILKGVVVAINCRCMSEEYQERERRRIAGRHDTLRNLAFSDPAQHSWTFANDNGRNPKMDIARRYCAKWDKIREKNYGLVLWGGVGCGKSYMAGCIANELIDRGIPVRMTSFARIMNDLMGSVSGRNEYIDRLCAAELLIIDDFGVERNTEYAMEQIYTVIDARYRSRMPLILTTNMTLEELQNPSDRMHSRIYDRILEMCLPVRFTGESMRRRKVSAEILA